MNYKGIKMQDEKQELINELNKLTEKPGGKQAIRFVLNALGSLPLIGGAIAGTGNAWGEKEQQKFNEKITDWASKTDIDLSKVLSHLADQMREPTEAHMSLLIGEVTGLDLQSDSTPRDFSLILNGETVRDFEPFINKGWITLRSNGNMANMGSGNRIGNSIEDKKRPWGMGNCFILSIKPAYFLCINS